MRVEGDETLDTRWRDDLGSFVPTPEHPGLVIGTRRLHAGRTAVFVVLAPVVAAALYLVMHMATFSPDAP